MQTTLWEAEQRIRDSRRKPTSADKILSELKKAGHFGLTNVELSKVCLSWHRRIGNLRAAGHNIRTDRISKGSFRYTLEADDPVNDLPTEGLSQTEDTLRRKV